MASSFLNHKSAGPVILECAHWLFNHNLIAAYFLLELKRETLNIKKFKFGSGRVLHMSAYLWLIILKTNEMIQI